MTIKAGLVGLPNVGKSTLFNALTRSQVPAENYPFCTIDPHLAITEVPDHRLGDLSAIFGSKKHIPATMSFVDIAGLVKGAAQGEGLGNQFLTHIREVDLILHVVRCFEGSGDVNPLEHFDIISTELLLKDLEMIEKRQAKIALSIKAVQNKPVEKLAFEKEQELLAKIKAACDRQDIDTVRTLTQQADVVTIPLLSAKKFLVIANMSEALLSEAHYLNNELFKQLVKRFGAERVIPACAKTEYELTLLAPEEAAEMMQMLGLKTSGLDAIIKKTYDELGLITFFTVGPKEAHAWPILKGTTVKRAAGEIHSDLERGFICAEVYNYKDIMHYQSENALKMAGKLRNEGQNYLVQDGDLLNIKFNV